MSDRRGNRSFLCWAVWALAVPFGCSHAVVVAAAELEGIHSEIYDAELVELEVGQTVGFVVKPRRPAGDGHRPWVWYAPSLRDERGVWTLPTKRHAGVISGLLDRGFYFCGVDVGESYGSPAGRAVYTEFYRLLVERHGLAAKACLFPVSRGGLMHYNWAAEHPECVQCIGAIYPVCNLRTYPGLKKLSAEYGIPANRLRMELDQHNPLDRLAPLAAARVPILHLQGDADQAVPLEANSAELARRYRELGATMRLVVVAGKGHEFAPEFWKNPVLPDFFIQHGTSRSIR